MRNLGITLLGALNILLDGESIKGLDSDKTRALLVYLALEADQPQRRDFLAEMFWPEKPEGVGRDSLKQALSNLRKALRERNAKTPFLLISREEIQFNTDSHFWADVNEFQELLEHVNNHNHPNLESCQACAHWLQQATGLYRGEFLEQFSLRGSSTFEEWILVRREAYQRQMSEALRNLILIHEANGDIVKACECAKQLVTLEPWNEENHRHFIRLLALHGMRSAALKQYFDCRRILMDELGIEPSQETNILYEQVKNRESEATDIAVPLPANFGPSSEDVKDKSRPSLPAWLKLSPLFVILLVGFTSLFFWNNHPAHHTVGDGSIPKKELEILIALYDQTNGPNWKNSNGWMSESSPCEWYGVTCSDGSVVSELRLDQNNLSGVIPEELDGLKNLYVLKLDQNQITGNIPPELGNLSKLRVLDLSFNLLSGSIPPELGNLVDLKELYVDGNPQLGGPIPPELGNLFNLTNLELSSYLGPTQLSGPIPPELGKLEQLMVLLIDSCQVSGPIPPELGQLTSLLWLGLSHNRISGTMPPEIGYLVNLDTFDIGGDDPDLLYGPLPMGMIKMTKLHSFDFRLTNFCEPSDPAFQLWLESIPALWRTNVRCDPG